MEEVLGMGNMVDVVSMVAVEAIQDVEEMVKAMVAKDLVVEMEVKEVKQQVLVLVDQD